jgi:hypothetical protein
MQSQNCLLACRTPGIGSPLCCFFLQFVHKSPGCSDYSCYFNEIRKEHTMLLLVLLFIKIGGVGIWNDTDSRSAIKIIYPFFYDFGGIGGAKMTLPENARIEFGKYCDIEPAQRSAEQICLVGAHSEFLFSKIGKYLFRAGKLRDIVKVNIITDSLR